MQIRGKLSLTRVAHAALNWTNQPLSVIFHVKHSIREEFRARLHTDPPKTVRFLRRRSPPRGFWWTSLSTSLPATCSAQFRYTLFTPAHNCKHKRRHRLCASVFHLICLIFQKLHSDLVVDRFIFFSEFLFLQWFCGALEMFWCISL